MVCPVQNSGNPGILLDYCARRLDSQTMAAMTRHMSACPECRKFAEAQEQVWSALDAWDAAPVSSDFDEKLYARISSYDRRKFWSRVFGEGFSWKPALSFGAALTTVAVAVVLNVPDRHQIAPSPAVLQPAAQVETLEPEQIERSIEDFEMLRQFSTPAQTI
jgi:hypothetical protein